MREKGTPQLQGRFGHARVPVQGGSGRRGVLNCGAFLHYDKRHLLQIQHG